MPQRVNTPEKSDLHSHRRASRSTMGSQQLGQSNGGLAIQSSDIVATSDMSLRQKENTKRTPNRVRASNFTKPTVPIAPIQKRKCVIDSGVQ